MLRPHALCADQGPAAYNGEHHGDDGHSEREELLEAEQAVIFVDLLLQLLKTHLRSFIWPPGSAALGTE